MHLTTADARTRWTELVAVAGRVVVGLDFDGTLSPIVEDPERAHIHPDAPVVLEALARQVGAVAVITGRPAHQVLELGGLEEVGSAIDHAGRELHVYGQYGHEQWSSLDGEIVSPRPPHGVTAYLEELPGVLRDAGAGDAHVEEKGLAVAVHTRRLPDAAATYRTLLPHLEELAQRHGLTLEPGRHVIEARAPGMDKGQVVHHLVAELDAGGFLFAGDDLGDLDAFAAVEELREQGLPTLLVCSASDEEPTLADRADVLVEGPAGVLDLLRTLTAEAEAMGGSGSS